MIRIKTHDAVPASKSPVSFQEKASKFCFAGVEFDRETMEETIIHIDELVRCHKPSMVVTANDYHVLSIAKDPEDAAVVAHADVVLADGQPIVWASRVLHQPLPERVAGSDLFPKLCEHAAKSGYRVFLLGGDTGTAEAAISVLKHNFPALLVSSYCPPFGFERSSEECAQALEAVCDAHPEIVFVGLGSPKQERWIAANMHEYGPSVSIGIGISFSFVGGQVKRAPLWMQRIGLEWCHRLCCEPRRLWRRYLIRGPRFAPLLMHELLKHRVNFIK